MYIANSLEDIALLFERYADNETPLANTKLGNAVAVNRSNVWKQAAMILRATQLRAKDAPQ